MTDDTTQLPPLAALISRLSERFADMDSSDPLRHDIGEAIKELGAIEFAPHAPHGWLWMTHPDHNDGQPIPVQVFADRTGAKWYRPFDTDATDYAWEQRDEEWAIVSGPLPVPNSAPLSEVLAEFACDPCGDCIDAGACSNPDGCPSTFGTAAREQQP